MKEYHYVECGLDNIYLLNGFEIKKVQGDEEIFIHDINGLHKAIGMILTSKRGLLSGKEIRFIRHALDFSQKRLADYLGVDYQTILRWEKDKGDIAKTADHLIKMIFFSYLDPINSDIRKKIDEIANLDSEKAQVAEKKKIRFEEFSQEWRMSA